MPQRKRRNNKKKKSKKSWKTSIRLQREKQIINVEEILDIEIVKPTVFENLPKDPEGSSEEILKMNGTFETRTEGETKTISCEGHLDDSVSNNINDDDYDYDDYYKELAENSEYELSIEGSVDDCDDDSESDCDYSYDPWSPTNAVVRGIPVQFSEEEVMAQLRHFSPIAVHRMISTETWQPMPLVLVQVPVFQKDWLFKMKKFRRLPVKVEEFRPTYDISQCKKCKQFGHVKNDCEILNSWKQEASSGNGSSTGDLEIGTILFDNSMSSSGESSSHSSSNSTPSTTDDEDNELDDDKSSASHKLQRSIGEIVKKLDDIANKPLYVIWNGIPTAIEALHILTDLRSKGFLVTNIYRLKDDHNRPTERVVFSVPKEQDHIFYMCCCLGFHVSVEKYDDDFSCIEERSVLNDEHKEFSMKKPIHVVIRGVPKDMSENDILEDLKRKRFTPVSVTRLVNPTAKKQNTPLPIVLLQMHREESHIYKLKCVLGFPVEVEGFVRHMYLVPQCKQCKKFGHKDCPIETGQLDEEVSSKHPKATLNVVLKGIPLEYEDDNIILDELKKCSFNPIAIHRMALGTDILPMYLVQVPKTQRRILFLTCFLGFYIIVEKHNPDLYPINQCDHCSNFGHHEGKCPNRPEKTNENAINKDIQLENKEIQIPKLQDFIGSEQRSIKRKRDSTEINVYVSDEKVSQDYYPKHSVKENLTENVLRCSSKNSSIKSDHISKSIDESNNSRTTYLSKVTLDASSNTDRMNDLMDELKQSVESYHSISERFFANMSSFITTYEVYDNSSNSLSKTLKCVLNLQSLCVLTTPFLDGLITVLKIMTSLMMNIPCIPDLKSNTLDEQLHLLEKLEEIKRNLEACPGRFTKDYDIHFPELQ